MNELINRQDAIDAFMKVTSDGDKAEWCKWVLEQLPSAEPEIIRCKDCEHYDRTPFLGTEYDYGKCGSPYIDAVMKPDDYCSFAERRTDE